MFNETGRDLYVPGFETAHHTNAQKGYHTFANLVWGHWSVTGYFNSRVIYAPVAGGGSIFDDQGTRLRDSRNFIGVNYTRDVGKSAKLRWQLNYDQYRYNDRFDYPLDGGQVEDNRTANWGDWVNSQLTYSFAAAPKLGTTTVGVQGSFELRNLQINQDVSPVPRTFLSVSVPDHSGAVFAQQEIPLAVHWTSYLGLRVDHSRNFGSFASPRLALVYQPSEGTAYKLVYGRPSTNPSSFERYYDDNGLAYVANPHLSRETAQAFEASVKRKLRNNLTAIVNAFDYRLRDVIQGVWISDTLMEYQNSGARRSNGVEFEMKASPAWWLQANGSFVVQKSNDGNLGQSLSNSPGRIAKVNLVGSVARNKLIAFGVSRIALEPLAGRLGGGPSGGLHNRPLLFQHCDDGDGDRVGGGEAAEQYLATFLLLVAPVLPGGGRRGRCHDSDLQDGWLEPVAAVAAAHGTGLCLISSAGAPSRRPDRAGDYVIAKRVPLRNPTTLERRRSRRSCSRPGSETGESHIRCQPRPRFVRDRGGGASWSEPQK